MCFLHSLLSIPCIKQGQLKSLYEILTFWNIQWQDCQHKSSLFRSLFPIDKISARSLAKTQNLWFESQRLWLERQPLPGKPQETFYSKCLQIFSLFVWLRGNDAFSQTAIRRYILLAFLATVEQRCFLSQSISSFAPMTHHCKYPHRLFVTL